MATYNLGPASSAGSFAARGGSAGIAPLVSVIVTCFNQCKFLPERFSSIVGQSYGNIEIIFVDDGSVDGSVEWVADRTFQVPSKIVVNSVRNGLPVLQWQAGISQSRGEFIWIAEADDASAPSFLETLISELRERSNVGMAYCQSVVISESGKVVDEHLRLTDSIDHARWRRDYVAPGRFEVAEFLSIKNTVPNVSACLFRKTVFADPAWMNSSLVLCGDWFAYAYILQRCDIAYRACPLNYHRRHRSSVRASVDRTWLRVLENYRVLSWIHEHFPEAEYNREHARREQFSAFIYTLGHVDNGDVRPPQALVSGAMAFDPEFLGRLAARYPHLKVAEVAGQSAQHSEPTPHCREFFPSGTVLRQGQLRCEVPRGVFKVLSTQNRSSLPDGGQMPPDERGLRVLGSSCGVWTVQHDGFCVVVAPHSNAWLELDVSAVCQPGAGLLVKLLPVTAFAGTEPSSTIRKIADLLRQLPYMGRWARRVEATRGPWIHYRLWKLRNFCRRRLNCIV